MDLLDTSYALVLPAPCQSFFSKMLGRMLTGKSTCSSTCSLIRHSTSVCPLDSQESFPYPQPPRTFRYPTAKLSFTTLFAVYSFTFPISKRPLLLITQRKITHSRSEVPLPVSALSSIVVNYLHQRKSKASTKLSIPHGSPVRIRTFNHNQGKFTTVRSKAVGISLWRLLV